MILISSTPNNTPQLHLLQDVNDTPVQVKLFGTQTLSLDINTKVDDSLRKPQFHTYKRNTYCLGQFSPNIVVGPEGFAYIMGIGPPGNPPTLAASGTGITGTAICYVTFVRKHPTSKRVLQESSPSPSATVVLTNQGRSWTNLPINVDPGVTHIRGYVSMDGADPRQAWEREVGTTSVTENKATLALGAVLQFDRDPPPYGAFGEIYHDRLWLINPTDPTKLWYSKQFEPESFTPVNFVHLLEGERVTAIKKYGDILLVFARSSTYALTGWGPEDFVIRKINPSVGCISPYSTLNIHNKLWFASEDGVYAFDGSFSNLMKDISTESWRVELANTPKGFANCQAVDDREHHVYKLLIAAELDGGIPYYYVGHYEKLEGELDGGLSQPDWVFDIRSRTDTAVGSLRDASSFKQVVYTGSSDGFVRRENVEANANDDSDSFNKKMLIRFKHYLMDEPGGDITEGKHIHRIWSYVESESNSWSLKLYGGDEKAGDATTPNWTDTVAASAVGGKLPKTVHVHVPEKVSGRGVTLAIEASSPVGMVVRGFGGTYGPGVATRGPS